jgi:hypothetical protein
LARGTLSAVVAALAGTAVLLIIIMQIKDVCILVADILAGFLRTVFYDNHLEILQLLRAEALQ